MRHIEDSVAHKQESATSVPCWSCVPLYMGDVMIVPLHVSDERVPLCEIEWQHIGFFESLDGEVEYHVYQRGKSISEVSQPFADYLTFDLRRAVSVEPKAEGA